MNTVRKALSSGQPVQTAAKVENREYFLNGDTDLRIKVIQADLTKAGWKLAADGIFGNDTENAVKAFQKSNGLMVDRIWSKASQTKLDAILANLNKALVKPTTPKPSVSVVRPKEEEGIMELKQWQKEEMRDIYKDAQVNKKIITSDEHGKSVMKGTLTVSDAVYLQTVLSGAALNGDKRLKKI